MELLRHSSTLALCAAAGPITLHEASDATRRSSDDAAGGLPLVVALVLLAAGGLVGHGALRLARRGVEWVLGRGWLRCQRRLGRHPTARCEAVALPITSRRDGDGDDWFELLGAWLAAAAGVPLDDRSTRADAPFDLEALRAKLEELGAFGRWIARRIRMKGS